MGKSLSHWEIEELSPAKRREFREPWGDWGFKDQINKGREHLGEGTRPYLTWQVRSEDTWPTEIHKVWQWGHPSGQCCDEARGPEVGRLKESWALRKTQPKPGHLFRQLETWPLLPAAEGKASPSYIWPQRPSVLEAGKEWCPGSQGLLLSGRLQPPPQHSPFVL